MNATVALAAFLLGLLVGLAIWYWGTRASREQNMELELQLKELQTQFRADAEKLSWAEHAEAKMREAFEALASRTLRNNSEVLAKRAKNDLENIVSPLKNNLTTLAEQVRELEKNRKGAYGALSQQLQHLGEAQVRLQKTTTSLTEALKSPTVRGQWGELQLRRVVELAGMVNHVSFEEQVSIDSGRPDMVVNLPNGGIVPIDAKVPLASYLTAMETADAHSRKVHLAQHAKAVRSRVRDLSQKQYWEQFETSPDFVVMFVPNEACLGAAFESDASLFEDAIQKKVLIASPINLLALLRAVAYGWQQHAIADNARKIAAEARELYGRMERFVGHFSDVGKQLRKVTNVYNKAVGSYDRRFVPAARRFYELGISETEMVGPESIELHPTAPSAAVESESDDTSRG